MSTVDEWAEAWGLIGHPCVADLRLRMGVGPKLPVPVEYATHTEAAVQQRARLEYAKGGALVYRNNVGAMQDDAGRWVRFGLANDSKQMNEEFKSGDLIGCRPVVIEPRMVGWTIGQFMSIECKAPGWKYTGTDREVAQLRWNELITSKGGLALFRSA